MGPNSQTQADWKAITKDRRGVASRFAQTFLRLPEYVDANPVKVAFSIAKVIFEIRRELLSLYLGHKLTIISGGRRQQ